MNGERNHDDELGSPAMKEALARRNNAEKREVEKRWREMDFPVSLSDALTRLTKDNLSDIRVNLNIAKASSLNKEALVRLLAEQVPLLLPMLLTQLDEARYRVLKRISDGGGQAYVPLEPYEYNYFKLRGLAFTGSIAGKRTLVMAEEILDNFRSIDGPSLRATVHRNTEWLRLTQGILHYYGFLPTPMLVTMVEQHAGGHVDAYELFRVVIEGIHYGYGIHAYRQGYAHEDVFEIELVMSEHLARPNLEYHPFTKVELLQAGKPGFVDRTLAYQAYVDYLRRIYQIDAVDAQDEADLCVYEIQNGESIREIIQRFTEDFEIPSMEALQSLTQYLAQLHNATRQWVLKGHTPNELSVADLAALRPLPSASQRAKGDVVDIATKQKVGRNDPCPCGSGNKFKKCCGR